MQIAVLTFDGFNELDSFIAAGIHASVEPFLGADPGARDEAAA